MLNHGKTSEMRLFFKIGSKLHESQTRGELLGQVDFSYQVNDLCNNGNTNEVQAYNYAIYIGV